MSEKHLLISRTTTGYLLEATNGADRVQLSASPSIEDVRASARGITAWTLDDTTGRPIVIVDRSGVE